MNKTISILSYSYSSSYNLIYNDQYTEDAVLEDVKLYKKFGGGTIVENSNYGLKRNIPFMKKVSEATGINVIAGTGKNFCNCNVRILCLFRKLHLN